MNIAKDMDSSNDLYEAGTSRDSCFFEDSSSSNVPDPVDSEIITKEMIKEEQVLAKENAKEEERLKKELAKAQAKEEARRIKEQNAEERRAQEQLEQQAKFKRLKHLLNKSQFYTNFLLKKIEASDAMKSKRQEPEAKKIAEQKKLEESKENIDSKGLKERNTNSTTSPRDGTKRNAKKRSLITDFIDKETINNAKKRRMDAEDDILKKPTPKETPSADVRINSMGFEVSANQPDLFEGGVLRQYQLHGIEWMKGLFENGVNGILADEMGLGKTVQIIGLLCHLIGKGVAGPYLIVAPLSTLPNWIMEFEKFAPKLPIILFHGSKDDRPKLYKKMKFKVRVTENLLAAPIVLTSYQVPLKEGPFMSTFNWRYIIVDEGHALKNSNTQLSRCLRSFKSVNRLLLTGTPLQNNLKELWSLLNFLLPEVFDDLAMFQSLFDLEAVTSSGMSQSILQKEAESHILTTLHQILTPFLLRRLKTDVELNLPPKKEVLVYCPLTSTQLEMYKATIDKVIELLLNVELKNNEKVDIDAPRKKRKCAEQKKDYTFKDIDWFGDKTSKKEEKPVEPVETPTGPQFFTNIRMANPDMQLRKIANHPYLVQMPVEIKDGSKVMVSSEEIVTQSGKMLALNAMLLKLHQRGHKVLIFSSFKTMLNLIEEFALMRNYKYVRLDGDDDIVERKESIRLFNTNPDIFLFLITTRAGGLGLNLTSADTVIIFDSDYNPQVDLQAMDRCHRIGQKKPVVVYRFASKGTIDEKILLVASGKRKLEKVVMKKDLFKLDAAAKKTQYDMEELKELLESTDHQKTIQSNGLVFTDEELEELLDRSVEDSKKKHGEHFKVLKSENSK